jgi:hypothetical protein
MQSPDNTVISTVGQSIVDSHGDTWTILADQVAVNGTVDPTTANVIELEPISIGLERERGSGVVDIFPEMEMIDGAALFGRSA